MLKDIRIEFEDNVLNQEKDIELFVLDTALRFLSVTEPLKLSKTEILRIHFYSNANNIYQKSDFINGITDNRPKWYGNFSDIYAYFPLSIFLKLDAQKQIHYTIKIIHNILYKLSNLYNNDNIYKLNNSYILCMKNNFLFKSGIKIEINDRMLSLFDYRELNSTYYYLCYQYKNYQKKFYIAEKKNIPLKIWKTYSLEKMISTPKNFNIETINEIEFLLKWGEQEKYIFNAENETIKTITNNAD